MANLTGDPNGAISSTVRQLETTDSATPSLWNNEFQKLITNDAVLNKSVADLLAGTTPVTDTMLGNRTADPTAIPTGSVGTLTSFLSWITNRIAAITGKTNWYDAPDASLATLNTRTSALSVNQASAQAASANLSLQQILDTLATRLKDATGKTNWYDAPDATLATLAARTGSVTVNDTVAQPTSDGPYTTLGDLLNAIVKQLTSITGKPDWFTAPAATLAAANSQYRWQVSGQDRALTLAATATTYFDLGELLLPNGASLHLRRRRGDSGSSLMAAIRPYNGSSPLSVVDVAGTTTAAYWSGNEASALMRTNTSGFDERVTLLVGITNSGAQHSAGYYHVWYDVEIVLP